MTYGCAALVSYDRLRDITPIEYHSRQFVLR